MAEAVNIYIDASQVAEVASHMAQVLSPENFEAMMKRTFMDTGRQVKSFVGLTVPQDYAVTPGYAMSKVQSPRPFGLGCLIPIKAIRGKIGTEYSASGGKGVVIAVITRGGRSRFPNPLPARHGGHAPFMMGGKGMTRGDHGIFQLVGLAVPQMPANRSYGKFMQKIADYTLERLQHNFEQMF